MRNRFYYISIVLLAIFSFSNRIISKNLSLNKADSLFNLKIYTEAKLIYDSLYYKENLYWRRTLLAISIIQKKNKFLISSKKILDDQIKKKFFFGDQKPSKRSPPAMIWENMFRD